MIFIAKFVALFLGALVLTKTYHDYKKGVENLTMFLFWMITWVAVMVVTLYPQLINWLLQKTGQRGAGIGTIFGLSLIFLFYVIYRVYLKAQKIEKNLQKLVREIAVQKIKS